MRVRRVAVLIPLLCAGCLGSSPSDGVFDVVFDPCQPVAVRPEPGTRAEEVAGVAWGIAMWNDRAGTRLALDEGGGAPAAGAAPVLPIRFQAAALVVFGVYEDEVGLVLVNRGLTDEHERAVTVAHELGHAMDLRHVNAAARPSVMNDGNLALEPNPGDVAALQARWGVCDAPRPGARND